ncbi:MAG: hypothetical protein HYW63_01380 [Candidatus Levybacteria bacterium]|nr:hypothetical protein [Candidatus Levybacteria bacterium]
MKKLQKTQLGYAVLTLLFFMTISMAIVTGIVIVVLNNALSTSSLEQGTVSYYSAESGIENALLRLIRDPNYTGESLQIDGATVGVQVSNGIITSTATFEKSIRKIQVDYVYNNSALTITSWKEIN